MNHAQKRKHFESVIIPFHRKPEPALLWRCVDNVFYVKQGDAIWWLERTGAEVAVGDGQRLTWAKNGEDHEAEAVFVNGAGICYVEADLKR